MLQALFEYLHNNFDIPGTGLFQYLSFRAVAAFILAIIILIFAGQPIIKLLRRQKVGETIRSLGLEGEKSKAGTPTMGGILILGAILIPTLLVGKLDNIYIQLMLVTTIWCGTIGFIDDYIKVFRHNKDGLNGRMKIVGQIGLGIIVGSVMFFSADVVVRRHSTITPQEQVAEGNVISSVHSVVVSKIDEKSTETTIPFVKNNEFDYSWLTGGNQTAAWVVYIIIAIFIITAVSNAANLTDGIDGLLTGVSTPIFAILAILAYLSGNVIYSDYLNIMYIPNSGELVVFAAAVIGALLGFLWYNSQPASIFMGDTGSLAIGGIIAVFALCIRKEMLLPIMCGVFVAESCSVILQRYYFKYTKRKYGEGRRIFRMSPLHHHYQKGGMADPKIMIRFTIVSLLLAAISLATLKIR
ncbi:MAG: phospho-N-acetylmuramoyl-pentapeptide-transferase [Alistipes sp.]|nr:phospho-N-acetylmuramoyl-pentapeptide-transferase [Alistipes sp.]